MGNVLEQIPMAKKIEQVCKIHPYSITPPTKSNKRWQTRYKDENSGKYKNLQAPTEEALLEKLVTLYFSNAYIDKLTFANLFEGWINYKKELVGSSNTITRHRQHYRKYFEKSKLHTMKLKQIDSLLLEMECNRIVKEFNLSRKEWTNVKTILLGMYDYAMRKKYLTVNPMDDVEIHVKYRQVIRKNWKDSNLQHRGACRVEPLSGYEIHRNTRFSLFSSTHELLSGFACWRACSVKMERLGG